uniref:Alpha-1,2-Mannosidase n=1 Tax=Mesocestoides corti TaxID=53468 RepID=A0A5K3ELX6_MESCO
MTIVTQVSYFIFYSRNFVLQLALPGHTLTGSLFLILANADDGRNCLELLSHVRRPSSQCSTRERIVVKESLSQGDDTWNITLGPVDDVESFVHVDEQSGSLTPKSPIVWSEFIAQHWPSTAYGDQCKDLMLAIFEATLSQIVDADRPKSQASVTKVSRHWRERISECLKPMAVNATDDCLSTHIRLVLVVRAMDAC